MSVLIKGMEMPTACSKCDCGNRDYGFCQITRDSWWHIDPSTERIENCPLVPIPDHGDLIDRDVLNATDSWEWIRYGAPVVIQAERSEECGIPKAIDELTKEVRELRKTIADGSKG